MWRDPRSGRNNIFQIYCSRCDELCENLFLKKSTGSSIRECETCNCNEVLFKCKQTTCGLYLWICSNCYTHSSFFKKLNNNKTSRYGYITRIKKNLSDSYLAILSVVVVSFLIITPWYLYEYSRSPGNKNLDLIERLKKLYPHQKNETWYHFLSVLEKEIPSVKSIIFLHGKDKETSDCLVNELVLLYTKNKHFKNEDITFSNLDADDYGFTLKHYHTVVKKFGVFITDLNRVSSNAARIFHFLCDEVSSDIKPSLFIFTLKYDERTELLKPMERAAFILKNTWNDLPDSDLFPLLSRVVKNVVHVVPEYPMKC